NRCAERLFGYSAGEVIGKPITILIPPHLFIEETIILEKIKRGEQVDHFETDRITKDGKILPISLTVSPIKDSLGRIIGASKIARDITERKRLEMELQERNKDLEELENSRMLFMRTISHEMGNLLNAIVSPIVLLNTNLDEEQRKRMFGILKRSTTDMRTLLEQLVDFSAILAGQEK